MKITKESLLDQSSGQIRHILREYCRIHGPREYVNMLILAQVNIRGGWSYNNCKADLATWIESHNSREG